MDADTGINDIMKYIENGYFILFIKQQLIYNIFQYISFPDFNIVHSWSALKPDLEEDTSPTSQESKQSAWCCLWSEKCEVKNRI